MSLKRELLTSFHSLALASALVCFISRIRFTSHNRRNNHKEVQQRGGEVGGEGRVAARGREARYGSWLQAHSGRSSLWSPADSLALGRAMVFVRKCASDCRLKYDSHPIRSRPARPRDCSRSRPSGRTEQSLGVCLAQRPLYYAAVQAHASAASGDRAHPAPPRPRRLLYVQQVVA